MLKLHSMIRLFDVACHLLSSLVASFYFCFSASHVLKEEESNCKISNGREDSFFFFSVIFPYKLIRTMLT